MLDRFGRFMPVGFYYRSFFKPKGAWKHWEPRIRAMAGLGKINKDAAHGYYDKAYGFHDVVVVGGGPAGMMAAIEAGKAGLDVLLLDEWPVLGGSLAFARFGAEAFEAERLRRNLITEIKSFANIKVMTSAVCTGAFTDNWLPVIRRNRLHKIRTEQVILATGSFEQPMVFRNNDLPGVMLSSAAQRLMRLYAVAPGRTAVIATANDHGYELALDMLEAGIKVAAVVDFARTIEPNELTDAMIERAVRVERGKTIHEALGKDHVEAVRLAKIEGQGEMGDPGPGSPATWFAPRPATARPATSSGMRAALLPMTTRARCIGFPAAERHGRRGLAQRRLSARRGASGRCACRLAGR